MKTPELKPAFQYSFLITVILYTIAFWYFVLPASAFMGDLYVLSWFGGIIILVVIFSEIAQYFTINKD